MKVTVYFGERCTDDYEDVGWTCDALNNLLIWREDIMVATYHRREWFKVVVVDD